jgi:AraC-like DNA-binding protein
MSSRSTQTLTNPQNGNLAFKLFSFDSADNFDYLQRNNYYSVIWLKEGEGKLKSDFRDYEFQKNILFAFSPYQPFMMYDTYGVAGYAICFHQDFFCIHKHQEDVACNGLLFNNIYEPPFTPVDGAAASSFEHLVEQMKMELQNGGLAQSELLVSYLKIFLITACRLRVERLPALQKGEPDKKEPLILKDLKQAIEKNFKTKHSAGHYANMLNISTKALGKITKFHFNKSLTHLISERIMIEAKRELYLTNKPVKEIAYQLGYDDEYYFSRFFKINADVSPQLYRETVGFGRAEAMAS